MRRLASAVAVIALVAGCSAAGGDPSSTPSLQPTPSEPAGTSPSPSGLAASTGSTDPGPSASAALALAPRPIFVAGDLVMFVSDGLRVRSRPAVSPDSLMYMPLLDSGTLATVLEGPVAGSGYRWYRIRLEGGVTLAGGRTEGWAAAGDRHGTP